MNLNQAVNMDDLGFTPEGLRGNDEPRSEPATSFASTSGLQTSSLAWPTCGGRFRHIANIMTLDVIYDRAESLPA